eukprot:COSAG01_NODE_389_length_17708_cov_111.404452_18_plen_72_part_00
MATIASCCGCASGCAAATAPSPLSPPPLPEPPFGLSIAGGGQSVLLGGARACSRPERGEPAVSILESVHID